eukprot:GEMP01011278.1.p1 GENE.GEMP01011278.1~~GEMP01011278.1.p1  ORF type:complete len:767 (+),score=204.59 GEMP01011278.1:38-2338(+)
MRLPKFNRKPQRHGDAGFSYVQNMEKVEPYASPPAAVCSRSLDIWMRSQLSNEVVVALDKMHSEKLQGQVKRAYYVYASGVLQTLDSIKRQGYIDVARALEDHLISELLGTRRRDKDNSHSPESPCSLRPHSTSPASALEMSGKAEMAISPPTFASQKSISAAHGSFRVRRMTYMSKAPSSLRGSANMMTVVAPVEVEEDDAEACDEEEESDDSKCEEEPQYAHEELLSRQYTEAQIQLLEEKACSAQLITELRAEQDRVSTLHNQLERLQIAHDQCTRDQRDLLSRCQLAESKVAEYSQIHSNLGQKRVQTNIVMQRLTDQLRSVSDKLSSQRDELSTAHRKNSELELELQLEQKNSAVMSNNAVENIELARKRLCEMDEERQKTHAARKEVEKLRADNSALEAAQQEAADLEVLLHSPRAKCVQQMEQEALSDDEFPDHHNADGADMKANLAGPASPPNKRSAKYRATVARMGTIAGELNSPLVLSLQSEVDRQQVELADAVQRYESEILERKRTAQAWSESQKRVYFLDMEKEELNARIDVLEAHVQDAITEHESMQDRAVSSESTVASFKAELTSDFIRFTEELAVAHEKCLREVAAKEKALQSLNDVETRYRVLLQDKSSKNGAIQELFDQLLEARAELQLLKPLLAHERQMKEELRKVLKKHVLGQNEREMKTRQLQCLLTTERKHFEAQIAVMTAVCSNDDKDEVPSEIFARRHLKDKHVILDGSLDGSLELHDDTETSHGLVRVSETETETPRLPPII